MSKSPFTQERMLKSYRLMGRCVLALLLPLILTGLWLFTAGPEYRGWARDYFPLLLAAWIYLLLTWTYFRIYGLRYLGADASTYRAKYIRIYGWLAFINFVFTILLAILLAFSVRWWPQFKDYLASLALFAINMAIFTFIYRFKYKSMDLDAFQTDNKGQDQRMVEKS